MNPFPLLGIPPPALTFQMIVALNPDSVCLVWFNGDIRVIGVGPIAGRRRPSSDESRGTSILRSAFSAVVPATKAGTTKDESDEVTLTSAGNGKTGKHTICIFPAGKGYNPRLPRVFGGQVTAAFNDGSRHRPSSVVLRLTSHEGRPFSVVPSPP